MKSFSKGSLSSAIRTLRNNRARSLMTMTGIIIAVVAAIVVVGIGVGVQRQVQSQVSRLGKDVITVRAGDVQKNGIFTDFSNSSPVSTLTDRDVQAARAASHVRSVTPLALADGAVSADEEGHFSGQVVGTTPDFAQVLHHELDFGSFFEDTEDKALMAVVGENVAAELFQENVPLGRGLSFRGQEFVVVGILKPFETTPLTGQIDFNNAIFIPYDTAQSITRNNAPVFEMLVRPSNANQVDRTVRSVNAALLRVHGGQQTFSVLKQGQSLGITNSILDLLSKLVLAAAATSLLVGGIGIMNIMWVSVTERMREVGIRKAVGATSRQIMGQFLTEALVLTITGWMLGALISIAVIWLIRLFTTLEPVVPWLMLGVSFVVTLATGVLFGSIPAIKAASKDPIDALRNE